MVAPQADVVTKGDFAALIGVSPARVSQYIAEGKITAPALVGVGRFAKIDVEAAKAQLRRGLDVSQRFGNGITTRLDAAAAPAEVEPPAAPAEVVALARDPVEERIKLEKLRELEYRNRDAAERELARHGTYVRADDAKAELARLASSMLTTFDGALSDFASAISAKFNLPQRDVLHELRGTFRQVRERAARATRDRSDATPSIHEDVIAEAPATVQ